MLIVATQTIGRKQVRDKKISFHSKLNFDYISSLKKYGITYSDSQKIQHVSPKSLDKYGKTHIYRIIQFHRSPAVKFAYDCVSEFEQNISNACYFRFTTYLFFYFFRTLCSLNSIHQQQIYQALTGLKFFLSFSCLPC